jgi:hypothetical protein
MSLHEEAALSEQAIQSEIRGIVKKIQAQPRVRQGASKTCR